MTAVAIPKTPWELPNGLPGLEPGDHLDQPTFHARYKGMPPDVRAELIGGIVYMSSPVRADHADLHGEVVAWLKMYKAATPGTRALDNATSILGRDSEPQPDAALIVTDGQTRERDGYIQGPPELIAEVASSSESYDLHSKLHDYEKYGVQEYLVLVVRLQKAIWHVRDPNNKFAEMPHDTDGIHRSPLFRGLWLDSAALFRQDTRRVQEVLNQGLASPEHARFCAEIQP